MSENHAERVLSPSTKLLYFKKSILIVSSFKKSFRSHCISLCLHFFIWTALKNRYLLQIVLCKYLCYGGKPLCPRLFPGDSISGNWDLAGAILDLPNQNLHF